MLNTKCFNQKESIPQSHFIYPFSFTGKLLEEAVEEAVAEAEVVEEEEEAQDDNFSSYSGKFLGNYHILGNLRFILYRSCLWYPFLIN